MTVATRMMEYPSVERCLGGVTHFDDAQSVDDAVEFCSQKAYNLVVGNRVIGFDQLGGVHLVEAIKGDAALAEIPVMVLSAFAETQRRLTAADRTLSLTVPAAAA